MIEGTPASTNTLPIWKPGGPFTGLTTFDPPTGMRAMRRRAAFGGSPKRAVMAAMISASSSSSTPKALATQSAVMSSWVGPMPPVVTT